MENAKQGGREQLIMCNREVKVGFTGNRKCKEMFEYDEGIRWLSGGRVFEEEEIVQKF